MENRLSIRTIISGLVVGVITASVSFAGDWPQFRGPNRDGVSSFEALNKSWPASGPEVLWRSKSGEGFSGMSIADGKLYTMVGRSGGEHVVALDAKSGNELWSHRLDDLFKNRFGNGPRSTPTVDGGTVYAMSSKGKLSALDSGSGSPRWTLDLAAQYGAQVPTWGISSSPLIDGDRLLVEIGGRDGYSVAALDKASGGVIWHSGTDQPGYSSPLMVTVGGVRQVVFMTGTKLLGLNPENGEVLWEQTWRTSYDVNASIPVFTAPNKLFISTGYDTGAALYTLHARDGRVTLEEAWKSRGMKNQFQASIVRDGIIYGFDNATFKALDLATGKEKWKMRGWGHGSLLYVDGHLIVLSDEGKLGLVRATPEGYEEIRSAQPLEGKSWTAPSLAHGVLYVRNEKEIVAMKVAK